MKFAVLLALPLFVVSCYAACNCSPQDQVCLYKCVTDTNNCMNSCDKSSPACQQSCITLNWPSASVSYTPAATISNASTAFPASVTPPGSTAAVSTTAAVASSGSIRPSSAAPTANTSGKKVSGAMSFRQTMGGTLGLIFVTVACSML